MLVHRAINLKRSPLSHLDRATVQNRQSPRKPQAHRTHIAVGRIPKPVRTPTENFAFRQQLHVHFKPDDRLVLGKHFRRDRCRLRRGFSHIETMIISSRRTSLSLATWHRGVSRQRRVSSDYTTHRDSTLFTATSLNNQTVLKTYFRNTAKHGAENCVDKDRVRE